MKALVLGYGNIGSVIVADLIRSAPSIEVTVVDKRIFRAENSVFVGTRNLTWIQLNVSDYPKLAQTMKGFDVVIGALPGEIGSNAVKASIAAKVNMVDVSYMPQNPLEFDDKARKAGTTIIPNCGVAPGLSNLLAGHAVAKLDRLENVHILVGGLPEKPVPPLDYTLTWSVSGLVDEYTRKAKIVQDGKVVEAEALGGLEIIEFPEVGKLEAFYTDGLSTLIHTAKNVKSMWEKTLRYPGHVEKINLLKALGFFDEKPVQLEDASISPRKLTIKLLEEKLRKPGSKDILLMKIEVNGTKRDSKTSYVYYLIDHYDEKHGITAMARTTAYTASIIAQLLSQKVIEGKGVIPPEKVATTREIFSKILNELEKRQIRITKSKETF